MQPDRRLIENIENAAQIRAKLRGETDPLRFAAAQGFRGTAQRQITEPDVLHEAKTLRDFRNEVVRDGLVRSAKAKLAHQLQCFGRGERGEIIDRLILQAHMPRNRVEARSVTRRARHRFVFIDPFEFAIGRQLIFQNGITGVFRAGLFFAVPNLAEPAAFLASAVRRVEREQARIEFFERASAARATHLRAHDGDAMFPIEQVRRAASDIERALHEIARFQNSLRVDRADHDVDRVLLKTLELPELRDRQ